MAGKKEETFVIRIHDCQNSTWQGSILWAEKQERKCFRSTLEMISLIEEAVQLDRENKALEGGYHEK
ncbi:hypothetical protein [Blautia sp. An81]|uniref:hypothetical protein n=1 Tax=Blautia sp. An81 TaxID=1965659 RepID=UPI000B3680FD|nr:hypothetical protein [Blautia sp. An81]OUN21464.1 hypothetical protein B5G33_20745 [Blautia sp. An81]